MSGSITATKKRGRPATGRGIPVQVRLKPDQLARLDEWIARNSPELSRPEGIRRLFERALDKG
jgi:hypothetical protein